MDKQNSLQLGTRLSGCGLFLVEGRMEKKMTWQVVEDNSGGIHLYVWQNDEMIYAHCGYEQGGDDWAAALKSDITALRDDGDTSDWAGNDLVDELIITACRISQTEDGHDVQGSVTTAEGNIIPLTEAEYYPHTGWDNGGYKVIADQDGIYCDKMGGNGRLFNGG